MPRNPVISFLCRSLLTAALCAAVAFPAVASEHADTDIENQRRLFKQVFATVERGDWRAVSGLSTADRQQLEDYLLWPDLRAAWFRATVRKADPVAVNQFLDEYGSLKPARELRYRHALELVRRGKLDAYYDIYQTYYQGLEIEKLDCLALQAELAAGRHQRIEVRARELWLVGKSQVEECDPVFKYLVDKDLLTTRDYMQRHALAIEAREFSLARWLAKSIDARHVEEARAWQLAQADPEAFLKTARPGFSSASLRAQLVYALDRLTYRDPVRALEHWSSVQNRYQFSEEQRIKTARHIALWTARDRLPGAYQLLANLPTAAQNDEVLRWRARSSLKARDWATLLRDINAMSIAERNSEEWRYWYAIALQDGGQIIASRAELEALAQERSYYGFLAADELDAPYALLHAELSVNEDDIEGMAAREDLLRARELYLVGLDGRGRSEWDAVIDYFPDAEKAQAAILADRWGWHSRAIATAASIGEYDDLSLRYPLPYRYEFTQHATTAQIPATWAYGIARSESLFMRDVRSSAGAIGLMQLMPATGRSVAREIKLPYAGIDTLTDPQANIRLGTTYLGQMAQRYGGNRVLATAAYNAGPHRVDRWMPEEGTIDARIWIENIPFNETRKYVRRVMAAETIFHWRLTGKTRRLSDELVLIEASPEEQQVAASH
jgi:soluble lytic murein transglycosylase